MPDLEELASPTAAPSSVHLVSPGFVSLVGAGPGDPGLITVAGRRRLREADVVIFDRLAGEPLLKEARPDAEMIYVGKGPGRHSFTQDAINALIVEKGEQGNRVCRLKGGDPFVFGRGGEEAIACINAGIPFEVIPGISSAIAAPAYAGIPVTHRKVAASFAVVTGHEDPTRPQSAIHWNHLATAVDTLVFLMGVENLEEIASQLITHGRPATTPAALVQWGTTSRQRTLVSTLGEIARQCREQTFTSPAVTIVGDVVALSDLLGWYERRPLWGKRVLVTRSREQASDLVRLLECSGAQVEEFPTIRTRPFTLNETPDLLPRLTPAYDWIIFNSVNAVKSFFDLIRAAGGDVRSIGSARICAVGPVTAAALEALGLRVDFMPAEAISTKIVAGFPEPAVGKRVLIPRAAVAPPDLPDALSKAGAHVDILPVYETLSDEGASVVREALERAEIDIVTFTSSSTVKNFVSALPPGGLPDSILTACIGPITARTAEEHGIRVDAIATNHTMAGLVAAVERLALATRATDERFAE